MVANNLHTHNNKYNTTNEKNNTIKQKKTGRMSWSEQHSTYVAHF